jgi:hypothetical protein
MGGDFLPSLSAFPIPAAAGCEKSGFFDGDGRVGANGYAALTTQTLVHVDRLRLSIFELKYADWAGVHAFPLAITFVFVYGNCIHVFSFTS